MCTLRGSVDAFTVLKKSPEPWKQTLGNQWKPECFQSTSSMMTRKQVIGGENGVTVHSSYRNEQQGAKHLYERVNALLHRGAFEKLVCEHRSVIVSV